MDVDTLERDEPDRGIRNRSSDAKFLTAPAECFSPMVSTAQA